MNGTKILLVSILLLSQVSVKGQFSLNLQFLFNGYSFSQNDNIVLLINNSSTNKQTAYLYVEISSDVEGLVGKGYSRSFVSSPGIVQFDKTSNQLFDSTLLTYDRSFEEAFIRNGELPSRNYTVCVTLFKSGNNQELAKICEILRTQKFQPPLNQFPFNRDTIRQENLNFQWIREQPNGNGFSYQILLVELLGKQSPNSAFATNNIFWKSIPEKIPSSIYPTSARPLIKNQRYAWLVEARSKDLVLRSEPTEFIVGETASNTIEPTKPKETKQVTYTELKFFRRGNQFINVKNGKCNFQYEAELNEQNIFYEIRDFNGRILKKDEIKLSDGLNLFEITLDASYNKYLKKNLSLIFTDNKGNRNNITLQISGL